MYKKLFLSLLFIVLFGIADTNLALAQDLLVDLRAEDLPDGTGVTVWPNRGAIDNFVARGTPVVEIVDGIKAVTFNGTSWFEGPTSIPGIEGAGTRTIEVWAYNPEIPSEETIVSWSHRGGPAGTNMAFNYGNNSSFGAVGHWSTPDMGWWGDHSPAPAAATWWQLVYTYDGSAARVYVDGVQESIVEVLLNTHPGNIIRVAAQSNDTGDNVEAQFNFTGSIASVRIYDRCLTADQVMDLFHGIFPTWLKAELPVPEDGATIPQTWANLGWSPGNAAVSHNVYFSDNFDSVNDGAEDAFYGNQTATFVIVGFPGFAYPDGLVPGTTYYWRIDEVNDLHPDSPWKGDTWSFNVPSRKAYNPVPADGAKYVDTNTKLGWTPGFGSVLHTVYFGDNFDDVNNASGGSALGTTSYNPGPLQLEKTYYWRVDELGAPNMHKGDVWSFETLPVVSAKDPNLVGWWKFDEGYGNKAVDWSGQNNHADIVGQPQWILGYDGGALKLDGTSDYVELPIGSVIESLTSSTFTIWVDFTNTGGAWQRIFDFGTGTTVNMFLTPRIDTNGQIRFAITNGGSAAEELATAPSTLPAGWHHLAATIDAVTHSLKLYLDGLVVASNNAVTLTPQALGKTTNNWIGRSQYAADAYFSGSVDDFRIYNYALSQDDIADTMRGDVTLAWAPDPADRSTPDIDTVIPLTFSPGDNASQHDVYFGTDENAVDNADASDTTGIYRGRRISASYTPDEGLEWGGGPYYWRIDEINADGTVSKGRLWRFTVADYLTVDDFESYNDLDPTDPRSNRIFNVWIDGFEDPANGSLVGYENPPFAELNIVHSGKQSMPFEYDNSAAKSEAVKTLTSRRDWTQQGVGILTIWFVGNVSNAPEPMYVVINGTAVVTHENSNVAKINQWTQWDIDLQTFADQSVNLANINTITIGFGSRNNPAAGGSGMMFFDDIRLYRSE
ncbi:MAG: LamG domain-containing protein [Sedimentisphaerales bacterium]|nr:LamG domain-containing protein [Sedimentisphaerales bacterium]